jgi:hypothetical protein
VLCGANVTSPSDVMLFKCDGRGRVTKLRTPTTVPTTPHALRHMERWDEKRV